MALCVLCLRRGVCRGNHYYLHGSIATEPKRRVYYCIGGFIQYISPATSLLNRRCYRYPLNQPASCPCQSEPVDLADDSASTSGADALTQ
jgi:hypothetical protein